MLLILEDNDERIRRFRSVLGLINLRLELRIWRNAWSMIREVEPFLPQADLISLDHDLEPEDGDSADPGTGWDVTRFLAARPAVCPVIIHTSNRDRSTWMMGEFDLAGWEYHRVPPLGEDWIERDWRRLVRRLVGPARVR